MFGHSRKVLNYQKFRNDEFENTAEMVTLMSRLTLPANENFSRHFTNKPYNWCLRKAHHLKIQNETTGKTYRK